MEYVILGLLMIRNLTQYDIKNALQQKVSPFYSASLGSIQAALKKLEANGHVVLNETVEGGRKKKIYAINNLGRPYFMNWMLLSVTPNRLEQDVPTKLFFLGLVPPQERLVIVKAVIQLLESIIQDFETSAVIAREKDAPMHLAHVVKYQLKTLDLGLFYHRSMLEWFKQFSLELEDK